MRGDGYGYSVDEKARQTGITFCSTAYIHLSEPRSGIFTGILAEMLGFFFVRGGWIAMVSILLGRVFLILMMDVRYRKGE